MNFVLARVTRRFRHTNGAGEKVLDELHGTEDIPENVYRDMMLIFPDGGRAAVAYVEFLILPREPGLQPVRYHVYTHTEPAENRAAAFASGRWGT